MNEINDMDIMTWPYIDLRLIENGDEEDENIQWYPVKVPTEELRAWLKQNVLSTDWQWDIYRYSVVGIYIMDPMIATLFKLRFGL